MTSITTRIPVICARAYTRVTGLCVLALACATAGAADLPQNIGPNLALGKTYKSSDTNHSGWNDGLTDGVWSSKRDNTYATDKSGKFPKTVTIDLGEKRSVAYVRLGVPNIGSTKTIEVSLSDNGKRFAPVGRHDFRMEVANDHLYAFAPVEARYVRLTFVENHKRTSTATRAYPPQYCFVSEVEVYGPQSPSSG